MLTDKQKTNLEYASLPVKELYDYLCGKLTLDSIPPTFQELQEALGISSLSVVRYRLNVLQSLGLIDYSARKARSIRLINVENTDSKIAQAALFQAEKEIRKLELELTSIKKELEYIRADYARSLTQLEFNLKSQLAGV
jgi:SOS-response transcriptional repressor LexA